MKLIIDLARNIFLNIKRIFIDRIKNRNNRKIVKNSYYMSDLIENLAINNESEPISNFPLKYYQYFLEQIKKLRIETITYKDIFYGS